MEKEIRNRVARLKLTLASDYFPKVELALCSDSSCSHEEELDAFAKVHE